MWRKHITILNGAFVLYMHVEINTATEKGKGTNFYLMEAFKNFTSETVLNFSVLFTKLYSGLRAPPLVTPCYKYTGTLCYCGCLAQLYTAVSASC